MRDTDSWLAFVSVIVLFILFAGAITPQPDRTFSITEKVPLPNGKFFQSEMEVLVFEDERTVQFDHIKVFLNEAGNLETHARICFSRACADTIGRPSNSRETAIWRQAFNLS